MVSASWPSVLSRCALEAVSAHPTRACLTYALLTSVTLPESVSSRDDPASIHSAQALYPIIIILLFTGCKYWSADRYGVP